MGKKSLAEQIAELSKPQNDFDIEDSEFADPFADLGSDGMSAAGSDDELKNEHYVAVPKSALRKLNDKLVVGKKYTGKVADRSSLYENGSLRADFSASDLDSEESIDGHKNEAEPGESGEESGQSAQESGDESDSGASLKENSDSEASDSESGEAIELDNEEDADGKRQRIKAMMAKERGHIVNRLSQAATQDALKGYAVMQQHKIFDAIIDSRLKIQKAVASSNVLPPNKEVMDSEQLSTDKTERRLHKATQKCYDLLDRIFHMRSALYTQDKLVTEPVERLPKKRTVDQYLEATRYYDDVLNQYRSSVLTKWLAKIQNSSGSSAMNAGKFRALNQSAEQQVVNNLADMDRLVKRTRLNRRQVKPLGYEYYEQSKQSKQNGDLQESQDGEESEVEADIPAGQHKSLNVQEMELIFDDEDFYRVLLNDLVDKKMQSSDPTSGLQFALRGAASTKLKKNVDSKASKGRKLRYHVQEPIANFETARHSLKWLDDQIDEFFASLLGQRVSMKEEEPQEEEEEDDLVVGQDTIQLFG